MLRRYALERDDKVLQGALLLVALGGLAMHEVVESDAVLQDVVDTTHNALERTVLAMTIVKGSMWGCRLTKTPKEKTQIRTTATMLVSLSSNQPQMVKKVAIRSTMRIAPASCHEGSEDQKGPLARVMKMSQFSVREISRKTTSSRLPKFWTIPPLELPAAYIVVTVIQVPIARTTPRRTDIPQSLGRFHLTGVWE